MKTLSTLFIALFMCAGIANAQVFWTETFTNGSSSGALVSSYTGPYGAWTLTINGTEGSDPNPWYISCVENGHTAGVCGTPCAAVSATATRESLHVGSATTGAGVGDAGATYDAGGLCGLIACPQTNRRAVSPVINLTGKSNIKLAFDYIENGDGANDDGSVWYYDGTTWSMLYNTPKTTLCGVQGTWTHDSVMLPASANNNPNVKIGFNWVNNDDGVGTDPSYAIDNVTLNAVAAQCDTVVLASITITNITATSAKVSWAAVTGAAGYEYKVDTFATAPTGSGTATTLLTATVTGLIHNHIYYAHVRDSCSATSLSAWVTKSFMTTTGINNVNGAGDFSINAYPNPTTDVLTIDINGKTGYNAQLQIMDITGKVVKNITTTAETVNIDMTNMAQGIYFIKYIDDVHIQTLKVNKQ